MILTSQSNFIIDNLILSFVNQKYFLNLHNVKILKGESWNEQICRITWFLPRGVDVLCSVWVKLKWGTSFLTFYLRMKFSIYSFTKSGGRPRRLPRVFSFEILWFGDTVKTHVSRLPYQDRYPSVWKYPASGSCQNTIKLLSSGRTAC